VADGLAHPEVPAATPSLMSKRLLVAYAVIAALLVGIGVAAFILFQPVNHTFSNWKPNGKTPQARAAQIGLHVQAEYKLDSGKPLLAMLYTPFQIGGEPVIRVGVANEATHKIAGLDVTSQTSVALYFLCQTTKDCPFQGATRNDIALMQAEGYEAALYALKYIPTLQSVLVALPSDLAHPPVLGMYIRRPNVKSLLLQPLSKTLGWSTPPTPTTLTKVEAAHLGSVAVPFTSGLKFTLFPQGGVGLGLLPLSSPSS
jgi:hypothetical protein